MVIVDHNAQDLLRVWCFVSLFSTRAILDGRSPFCTNDMFVSDLSQPCLNRRCDNIAFAQCVSVVQDKGVAAHNWHISM